MDREPPDDVDAAFLAFVVGAIIVLGLAIATHGAFPW